MKNQHKATFRLLLSTVALSLGLLSTPALGQKTITFGVVPQQAAAKLARKWAPVFQYLSQKTGLKVVFKTAPNIPEFERRVLAKEYSLAYMNPYHFVAFHEKAGYRALARAKDKRIHGIVVVRKDTEITQLQQLGGQTLAFPSPAAFAASILPRGSMKSQQINFTPQYVSSHDSVYLNVAKGIYPAGGGVVRTFNNTNPEIRKQLKVLWKTPGYTPHAIAYQPGLVDEKAAAALQKAIVGMDQDPQGQALVKALNLKGFVTAQDSDWDDVRSLNIDLLK